MRQHIKKTLETLLILISTSILTNCKTQKEQIFVISKPIIQQTQEKIEYKTFHIESQQPYTVKLKDYRKAIKYIDYIESECRTILENPEDFPEVLKIIDANRDRMITPEEALTAYYSPHIRKKIKNISNSDSTEPSR
mgnify:CR=1 FL=1